LSKRGSKQKQNKEPYDHARLQEDCDNYINSVLATLAFINELRWDEGKRALNPDTKYCVGRRMTTSATNEVNPSADVTPDLVVQGDEVGGIVGEVTYKLTSVEQFWEDKIKQMKKYDDDLVGWWSENEHIVNHDLSLLVSASRSVLVSDLLQSKQNADPPLNFARNVSIIGFERVSGALQEMISLKKESGVLSNERVSEKLRRSVRVNLQTLLMVYKDKQFVDFEPPQPLLLQIMWEKLFSYYASEGHSFDELGRVIQIELTVSQVTKDLQRFYGFESQDDRSPQAPKAIWVRKALDRLVQVELAIKTQEGYLVLYRRLRGDVLERFGKLVHRAGPLPSAGGEAQGVLALGESSSN
jgi:hypothetical protein